MVATETKLVCDLTGVHGVRQVLAEERGGGREGGSVIREEGREKCLMREGGNG